jgi:hypothetical protein
MLRLDTTTRKLQIVLSGAITTNQLPVMVMYSDRTSTEYSGAAQLSNTNSTTAVDICAAPAASTVRDVDYLSVRNSDTVSATVTIRYNDNATIYLIVSAILAVGDQLVFTHGDGWRVVDASGQTKVTTPATAGDVVATGAIIGDPGSENTGIDINGVTYQSTFKVSDIDGTNYAQTILHRHSTTLEPLILGARSNSNTSSHAAVTNGQGLFTIYAAGRASTAYQLAAAMTFAVGTGTISDTSMPGKVTIGVTPNGAVAPVTALTIDSDKSATFAGGVIVPAGSVSTPAVATAGDTNTGIYFSAADTIDLTVGGVQHTKFKSNGGVQFGSTAFGNAPFSIFGPLPGIDFCSPTAVVANISLFSLGGYGNDGSTYSIGATLNFKAEEAWSTTAHGAYLQFRTVLAGTTTLSEKMRLISRGALLIGTASDANTGLLQVAGTAYATGLRLDYTNTATVDAVTIDKASGRVNIAAAGTAVVVTNSLVTAASHVFVVASTADATARVTSVVPAAGSFTINTVACTAQTSFDFLVINAD